MRDLPELLFASNNLDDVLRNNLSQAVQAVDEIPERQFTNASENDILENIYSICEVLPIELHEDKKEMDTEEVDIDVSNDPRRMVYDRDSPLYIRGVRITVSIPFTGDVKLWKCQPNPFNMNPPRANVRADSNNGHSGFIDIVDERPIDAIDNGAAINERIVGTMSSINWYLDRIRAQVNGHNTQLSVHIRRCIQSREQRLGKHLQIAKVLDIPLKKKDGAPEISLIPIKRRIVKPLISKPDVEPEPGISDEEYENILKFVRHVGRTFETTPKTFIVHDEEGLRDIMIAHLNGYYEGSATGETFRKLGKTDIRIEDNNRAAFVGECKVWKGDKGLSDAIDQLLSYLTWRECKAALVIFNKKISGFLSIQKKLPNIIRSHQNFRSEIKSLEQGEWRFRLYSAEDNEREIIVHVFLFNLYVAP